MSIFFLQTCQTPVFRMSPGFRSWSRFTNLLPVFYVCPGFPSGSRFSKWVPFFQLGPGLQSGIRFAKWFPVFQVGLGFPSGSRFSKWDPVCKVVPSFPSGSRFSKLLKFHRLDTNRIKPVNFIDWIALLSLKYTLITFPIPVYIYFHRHLKSREKPYFRSILIFGDNFFRENSWITS